MRVRGRKALVCNCEVTMALDGRRLADALDADEPCTVHTQLCRAQLDRYREAVAEGEPLLVACSSSGL